MKGLSESKRKIWFVSGVSIGLGFGCLAFGFFTWFWLNSWLGGVFRTIESYGYTVPSSAYLDFSQVMWQFMLAVLCGFALVFAGLFNYIRKHAE